MYHCKVPLPFFCDKLTLLDYRLTVHTFHHVFYIQNYRDTHNAIYCKMFIIYQHMVFSNNIDSFVISSRWLDLVLRYICGYYLQKKIRRMVWIKVCRVSLKHFSSFTDGRPTDNILEKKAPKGNTIPYL